MRRPGYAESLMVSGQDFCFADLRAVVAEVGLDRRRHRHEVQKCGVSFVKQREQPLSCAHSESVKLET